MRSVEEFEVVQLLITTGMKDCSIACQTGIPRRTVWDWRCTTNSSEESEYIIRLRNRS